MRPMTDTPRNRWQLFQYYPNSLVPFPIRRLSSSPMVPDKHPRSSSNRRRLDIDPTRKYGIDISLTSIRGSLLSGIDMYIHYIVLCLIWLCGVILKHAWFWGLKAIHNRLPYPRLLPMSPQSHAKPFDTHYGPVTPFGDIKLGKLFVQIMV